MPNLRSVHGDQPASAGEATAGPADPSDPPCTDVQAPERDRKLLSDVRRAAAGPASRLLARAAGSTRGGPGAIARWLQVSSSTVGRWLDEDEPAAMSVRDVVAGPRGFCRAVGAALVQHADESAPIVAAESVEAHIVRLTRELGDVANTDPSDRPRLDRELRELVDAAERARRDLRGAP